MNEVIHHPEGYRHLGLRAVTLALRWRRDASVPRLAQRLERWEHERGNPYFEARNLERVPGALAYELVHVYVSLREWFPAVRPDYIDFSARMPRNTLADAVTYPSSLPALRAACARVGIDRFDDACDADDLDELHQDQDVRIELRVAEQLESRRPVDLSATGSIAMNRLFSTRKGYAGLLREWEQRNANARARQRPGRVPPLAISAASAVLIHEFGHLVDDSLFERGMRPAIRVYGALSQALYGGRRPQPSQWGRHLVNYPCRIAEQAGPYAGGAERGALVRRSRRDEIAFQLGTYATTTRDELFADAFALSFGAGDVTLRRELRAVRRALVQTGLGRTRRPRATNVRTR